MQGYSISARPAVPSLGSPVALTPTRALLRCPPQATLLADGKLECFRISSGEGFAAALMYSFMLVTVLMLINMLIALMAKSFDNIFEQVTR